MPARPRRERIATSTDTTRAVARNGLNSRHGDMPAAFMTISSESVESLLSTCPTEITMAIGAITRMRRGTISDVMPRNTRIV